ncbi:unnamed protein product [marine sediment metagenome]|uniref:Uncharacterized protein n=1 Tax=marine sediment metagenome TaxID=412755 RepID=X0YG56_9ZZZZ
MYDKITILKINFGLNLHLKFNLVQDENSLLKQIATTGIIATIHINNKIVIENFNIVSETLNFINSPKK